MNTGVYAIEHTPTGKVYVGSAANFDQRWRVHRCLLRKGAHHSAHLQAAWNRDGEQAFLFKRLVVTTKADMLMYEQRIIDGLKAADRRYGYNAAPVSGSQLGFKHSDQSRAKIRARRATQVFSAETRALWAKNRTGRKMPDWFGPSVSARCKNAPLAVTAEQQKEICARHLAGETQAALAREFGVASTTIHYMVHRNGAQRRKGNCRGT